MSLFFIFNLHFWNLFDLIFILNLCLNLFNMLGF